MNGTITIKTLAETDSPAEPAYAFIRFKNPIEVEWFAEVNPKEASKSFNVNIEIEPGITWDTTISEHGIKHPAHHLTGETQEDFENAVLRHVAFHIAHAFNHPDMDPNYTTLHWALYGNLRDNTILLDPETDPDEEESLLTNPLPDDQKPYQAQGAHIWDSRRPSADPKIATANDAETAEKIASALNAQFEKSAKLAEAALIMGAP